MANLHHMFTYDIAAPKPMRGYSLWTPVKFHSTMCINILLALGISPHAITAIAYTTNGGQFSDSLQHATNILLQLSNQHDLDRLAERWYSSLPPPPTVSTMAPSSLPNAPSA